MALQQRRVDAYLGAIDAIARSPCVAQYVVGFTKRAGWHRRSEYISVEYDHLVVLADKLTRDDAIDLEFRLQNAAWANHRSVLFRKYEKRRRDKGHNYKNAGATSAKVDGLVHSVYMAWWSD